MHAERRAGERQIDEQRRREVADDEPRRRRRQRPEVEQLVDEQHADEERQRHPLLPEPPRPVTGGSVQAAAEVAHHDHRARATERVAGRKQHADQQTAIVDPRQHRGEIFRRQLRPVAPVPHDHDRHEQQDDLRRRAQPPPPQQRADNRPAKDMVPWERRRGTHAVSPGWANVGDVDATLDPARHPRASRRPAVPSHPAWERERHVLNARRPLDAVGQHGRHAGMRHVSFEPHPCTFHMSARRVANGHHQGCGTDGGRLRAKRPAHVQ